MLAKNFADRESDRLFGACLREREHRRTGAAERNAEQTRHFQVEDFVQSGNRRRAVWLMDSITHRLTY